MGLTTEPTVRESRRPPKRWPFSFADSRMNPWRGLGGLPREVWLLFATNLINRAGMMVLPFLVLYLTGGTSYGPRGFMSLLWRVGNRWALEAGASAIVRSVTYSRALIALGSFCFLFPRRRASPPSPR